MCIIEALERRDTEMADRLVRQHSLDLAAHVDSTAISSIETGPTGRRDPSAGRRGRAAMVKTIE
jgi:hypothetical protein